VVPLLHDEKSFSSFCAAIDSTPLAGGADGVGDGAAAVLLAFRRRICVSNAVRIASAR
jgi:hypothetical protein